MRDATGVAWRGRALLALAVVAVACGAGPSSSNPAREAATASTALDPEATPDGAGDEAAIDPSSAASVDPSALARVAVRHQAWPGGRLLHETHPEVWRARVAAGSLMKLATTIAAIDAARLDPAIRFSCRRRERVNGRVLDCVHPPLGASLTLADALAHSCNSVFLQVAARLSRDDLDEGLARLGVNAHVGGGSVALAAVGVEGVEVEPSQWAAAIVRLARGEARVSPAARAVVLEGLRGAVTSGTARALGLARPDALAKTSTAPLPDGTVRATVALAWPHEAPVHSLVVAASGVSGRDAADLAAAWLRRERLGANEAPEEGGARAPGVDRGVRVGRAGASGYRIETMPLEDYVAAVVAGEAPGDAPAALNEAMAIVARSFVRADGSRHARDGFDVCDLTHCQVLGTARAVTREAARRTRGLVVADAGRPRRVYYHASCAGWLEPAARVWPSITRGSAPMPAPRRDPAAHPVETWTSDARAPDVERALRAAGLAGSLDRLEVMRSATTGRVERVRVRGMVPGELGGEEFRGAVGRTLGWHVLKSAYFTSTPTSSGFRFSGAGRGHGVGLCVRGALALAEAGQSAREILAAYVPGATLVALAPIAAAETAAATPALAFTLQLPLLDEPQRPRLERLIREYVAHLSRRLDIEPEGSLTLRFHPTHESFRRATKQATWVSGITEGTVRTRDDERTIEMRIELIPVRLLDGRGQLEKTLRHEIAHALTGPELVGRPRWVHEGVVVWATGELVPARGRRCPSDAEFASAGTSETLAQLYRRAAGCVADAVALGIDWRDVGR